MKVTHGSGFNIICKDKNELNISEIKKILNKWIKTDYSKYTKEWVYENIEPKIIIEPYLLDNETQDLKDYKVHCFNGVPEFIQVDFDRFDSHKKNLYDLDWNFLDVSYNYPNDKDTKIKKPKRISEILKLARILSEDFPYARIDFYEVNNKVIFGEITFFPANGFGKFTPEIFNKKLGEKMKLPDKNKPI